MTKNPYATTKAETKDKQRPKEGKTATKPASEGRQTETNGNEVKPNAAKLEDKSRHKIEIQ